MLKNRNLLRIIFMTSLVLLSFSSYEYLVNKNYWQLYINLEFIIVIIYLTFIYPKKPLNITQFILILLLVHFIGYGINSLLINNYFKLLLSIIYVLGFIIYQNYRKKNKYPIYLKSRIR